MINFSLIRDVVSAMLFMIIAAIIVFGFAAFADVESVQIQQVSIVSKINDYVVVIFMALGVLTTVASALARGANVIAKLTNSTDDDEKISKFASFMNRVAEFLLDLCQIFPTVGVNPRTQQLKAELEALKNQKDVSNA